MVDEEMLDSMFAQSSVARVSNGVTGDLRGSW
jgi:hypothetical protein